MDIRGPGHLSMTQECVSDWEIPGRPAGNLVACGHVDHIDEKIHQRRAEREGEVV